MATKQAKVPPEGESKELYISFPEAVQATIKGILLQALAEEQDASARNKLGDAVAELARQHVDDGMEQRIIICDRECPC